MANINSIETVHKRISRLEKQLKVGTSIHQANIYQTRAVHETRKSGTTTLKKQRKIAGL